MISFIKNSLRELKHVVWPTKEETRNYFLVVLIILIVFGLYLFFASTLFSEAMLYLKWLIS